MRPALQPHGWGCAELLMGLATAVMIEAINRPITIGSQIYFPITLLARGGEKRLEARGGPEIIPAMSLLWPIICLLYTSDAADE